MKRVFLRAMVGIGDNLYARPFVRAIAEQTDTQVSLMTGFPQLFEDIPRIRMVRAQTSIPYVQDNIRFWGETHDWRGAPRIDGKESPKMEPTFISYDPNDPANVTDQIARMFPIRRYYFDLPPPNEDTLRMSVLRTLYRERYVVVRPVVVREGFGTTARNALPGYIYAATEQLKAAGIKTVSVANFNANETGVAPLPQADVTLNEGELNIPELIHLFRNSAGVVSGPGFAMPMAVAARVPLLAVWGARGALDNPGRIFHPKMKLDSVINAIPANFCQHTLGECDCLKLIPDFHTKLQSFIRGL